MRFPLLHSNRLYLADCEVTVTQVNAGWVYLDGGLSEREVLTDGEVAIAIQISPKIQAITQPTEFYLSNDVIEFLRC